MVSHSDDDNHSLIGSKSPTPSGVATPRPDPSDKRLPGILHTYFGQVRESSFTTPSVHGCPLPAHNTQVTENMNPTWKLRHEFAGGALPTAPSSPREGDVAPSHQSLLPPSLDRIDYSRHGVKLDLIAVPLYPTPPTSSSSSTRKVSETGSDGSPQLREAESSAPFLARQGLGDNGKALCPRRETASLNPLSNITTISSVHAAHISNPTSFRPSSTPSTPTSDTHALSALSSLTSHLELVKLTDGVAPPRKKNTPPLTPRALSNDGSELARPNPATIDQDKSRSERARAIPTPRSSPPVSPPKGKLIVRISEARALTPSYNPYAVCAFEWIESIASGPTPRVVEPRPEAMKREQSAGGLPIKRSGSDMGRWMAIPMKSRQSSTTSLNEHKEFRNGRVTDPKWDHEAVL